MRLCLQNSVYVYYSFGTWPLVHICSVCGVYLKNYNLRLSYFFPESYLSSLTCSFTAPDPSEQESEVLKQGQIGSAKWFVRYGDVWELSHPDGWGLWVGTTDQNVSSLVDVGPKSGPGTVVYTTPFSSFANVGICWNLYGWELSDPIFTCVHLESSM